MPRQPRLPLNYPSRKRANRPLSPSEEAAAVRAWNQNWKVGIRVTVELDGMLVGGYTISEARYEHGVGVIAFEADGGTFTRTVRLVSVCPSGQAQQQKGGA